MPCSLRRLGPRSAGTFHAAGGADERALTAEAHVFPRGRLWAARLINNPRRTKIGHVEDFPVLHMRSLRKSATSGRLRLFFLGGNLPGRPMGSERNPHPTGHRMVCDIEHDLDGAGAYIFDFAASWL